MVVPDFVNSARGGRYIEAVLNSNTCANITKDVGGERMCPIGWLG
eukprot:COSAG01_NODE_10074_length_2256_cov_1.628187_2_plen_45_part_00